MSKNNRRIGIDRREFIKISATTMATVAGLVQFGKGQAMEHKDSIKPFKIEISEEVLKDLRERLERTRFPDQLEDVGWSYGTDLSYLKELCAYWLSEFDWRAQERALNRFNHFRTEIDGLGIHFIHQRSKKKNAFPLIITHGWPGSFFEFTKIIGPLTDPVAHGGRSEDAFHVICPSIPGYGFSDAPKRSGFGCRQIADVFSKLMAKLGYTQYGAYGGDWGFAVSTWLASIDSSHVKGLHLYAPLGYPPDETSADTTEELPSSPKFLIV